MIIAYHPTTIKLHSEHCPHAVQLWKQGEKYDRSIFHTGVVAHSILEEIGKNPDKEPQQIADEQVETHCSKGREYDKNPEPPAPIPDALEGARLALRWHSRNPVPSGEGIHHEEHYAYDKDWKEVPYYNNNARFRTILDVVEVEEQYDEASEETYTSVTVRDYKTSWMATDKELDTFQRRCQAVVAWLRYQPDIIILEIANLRMGKTYHKEINTHFETDKLEKWKDDISLAIRTLDNQLNPSPGSGCIRCPYSRICKHFDQMNNEEDIIKQYIAAKETITRLEPLVKKATKDKTKDGVGFQTKERKKVLDDASQTLLAKWIENDGTVEQLYDTLDLSVTSITNIAKILTKNRQQRDELMSTMTKPEQYPSFGIKKNAKT